MQNGKVAQQVRRLGGNGRDTEAVIGVPAEELVPVVAGAATDGAPSRN
jgi:hypothetical protein